MKRFTSLMLTLVLAVAAWAGPTDLPQITTDLNNPIYYTISNTRSEGKVIYYTAEGVRDENPQVLTDAHKFFFTGSSLEDLKIHNAEAEKSGLLFNGSGAWTAEGTSCKISVTPYGDGTTGLAIEYKGTSLNEHNQGRNTYCEWSANDEGSIYVMDLVAAWPEAGKLYVIEAPLFEASTGVAKGLYANEDGSLGWKATELDNKNFVWTVEYNAENGYTIKNYGTEKYLSFVPANDRFVVTETVEYYASLKFLSQGQFNIVANGGTMHAGQHGGGAGASGNVVSWGGQIGSASAWAFVECQDPDAVKPVTITYNFTYKGEATEYTQTVETIVGEEYPAITVAFPFGITATKPAGTIAADAETTVTISLEENLPFAYYSSYDAIENWYYVKLKGANYLYHVDNQGYIALDQATVPAAGKAAYSWAFVGDPFNGFQLVNMAAGEGYVLSSTTSITDDANTHPVMTSTPVANGNNELWVLTASTYQENGFYMAQKGFASNRMNNRNNKLAYWTGGADNGSTFTVELRPSSVAELTALVAQAKALLAQITIGEAVGQYSTSYEGYEAAYAEIAAYVEGGEMEETVAEEYVITLSAIINSFSLNAPVAGKYYTFSNGGYYITSNVANDRIACSETKDATAIYYFDGSHLLAYTTGLYFGLNANDWTFEAVGSDDISAIEFVAAANGAAGKFNIKSGGRWLHRTDAYINRCSNNTCGELHNWTIEEVTSLPVSITAAGYATFFAPVAVAVEGVTAHTVTVDGEYAQLSEALTDIPANTGVVLKGAEGTYNFAITSAAEFEGENLMAGTIAKSVVAKNNAECYVLANGDNGVGLYVAKNGENTAEFLNAGHKAYLAVEGASGIKSYSFRFEGATTGIENVEVENAAVIYDLTGRQVNAVERGIYIINGKKVLVK